jgi:transcriptional regulator with XRE-family HTH domain
MIDKLIENEKMELQAGWNSAQFATRLKAMIGKNPASRFARKCGLNEATLRKYLMGEAIPGADKLLRIAQVAGVNLHWLATGESNQSVAAEWDIVTPPRLAIVLAFERFARRRADTGSRSAVSVFVREYNAGLLETGAIGDIARITEEELTLWRDLAREKRVQKAAIDEAELRTAIEIAEELMEASGKAMDKERRARLIVAIYRVNAMTEGGVDRSMLMNLLVAIS